MRAHTLGQHLAVAATRWHPAAGLGLRGTAGLEAAGLQGFLQALQFGQHKVIGNTEIGSGFEHGEGRRGEGTAGGCRAVK